MEEGTTSQNIHTQQSSNKINTSPNENKKEGNTTEVNKGKAISIFQSDTSNKNKENVQENNTITSAYFNPIIHLTPQKT